MARGRRRSDPTSGPGSAPLPVPASVAIDPSSPRHRGLLFLCAGVGALLVLAAIELWWSSRTGSGRRADQRQVAQKLTAVRAALQRRDLTTAERLIGEVLKEDPAQGEAIIFGAQIALQRGDARGAIERLAGLPDGESDSLTAGRTLAATLLQQAGRFTEAEQRWKQVLAADRSNPPRIEYAKLLGWTGRFTEARALLEQTLSDPALPVQHLLWAARPEVILDRRMAESLRGWRTTSPRDPLLPLGLGAFAELQGDPKEAETFYREALELDPRSLETRLRLGARILDRVPQEWDRWLEALPPEVATAARDRAEYWRQVASRGVTVQRPLFALAASLRAVSIDTLDRGSAYQAGVLAAQLGLSDLSRRMQQRTTELDRRKTLMDLVIDQTATPDDLVSLARLERNLGHPGEGLAWFRQGVFRDARILEASRELFDELSRGESGPAVVRESDLHAVLGKLPPDERATSAEDRWWIALIRGATPTPLRKGGDSPPGTMGDEAVTSSDSTSNIHLRDDAEAVGIRMRYHNAHDPAQVPMRMQEFTGGGVAWLDFDRDGALDLFATQGTDWPAGESLPPDSRAAGDPSLQDSLFRQGAGRFTDVAPRALPRESGFGQGAAAGDLDEDGFPDLYVANIGQDRVWHNLGDGTYEDATTAAGIVETDWSTSVALADLTGDGLTDIYVANYARGKTVFTEICHDRDGTPRSCKPTIFEACPDRFYANAGDGTFREETPQFGLTGENGRGLGVVAWDADGSGRLGLFVANDGTANFFFRRSNETPPQLFSEQALASGLAYDEFGKPQACMGVAAGDADGDGRTDLYVTNYYHESNTLYRAQGEGAFLDETRETGLREPSLNQLGFGTQFFDADLDGDDDLIVANGHEGDYRDLGIPFAMPPQMFRNGGAARFTELTATEVGPYFAGRYLGRGLATGDWNRDGLVDVAITHLDAPLALLTNTSPPRGGFVAVHLRGTTSPRDPIGAQVTIGKRTKQLTSGDGYLASNERRLVFALPQSEMGPLEITVRWPGGTVSRWSVAARNREILLIEGEPEGFLLPDRSPANN